MIAFRRGDTAKAVGEIHDACALFASVDAMTPIWYAGWEGLVLVTSGREDEAAAVVEAQEQRLATLPEDALAARSARTTLALIYAFLGDRDGAARCEAALQPFADDFHWTSTRRSLAALAALRGDTATALQHLTRAERLARGQAALPELALTLLARADLLPPGDGDAERCRREAQRIVDRTGASIPERPRNASAPPRGRDGLSAREVEVLRLVAQGKTNREIAGELVLSERTVINHLSHIFTKIDAPNRSTATAYALRHGIA
jgi:DNA-binding NarL/FixJ family response regulator